ncbi:MAG: type I glyceraldehyde-3-phosphate dehydrogenase, partial [Alphaproteobacteria bacterium]|nr:type I glyceraldehyde-3-phosphate dehydrogenase [Alphaproteobacteria bacterium]
MTLRIAINGFGRIGRMVMRAFAEQAPNDMEIVAINDLTPVGISAHLFEYDSVHGHYAKPVSHGDDWMDTGFGKMQYLQVSDPTQLPWKDLNIDIVFECSGRFTDRPDAAKHLEAGAKRVLVSAPSKDVDITVVYGVNHDKITGDHTVISNASCTTNCLAPVAAVLQDTVGILRGYMSTIHAYTGDQKLVDTGHSDVRRARAGAMSMIPTSTGAAKALGLVIPELKGKLDGSSIRVPTPNVSVIDFKFDAAKATTIETINSAMKIASEGAMIGVLGYNTKALVSIDFNHNPASSIFDATQTQVIDGTFVRVLSWYDNEWGFSNRMFDVARVIGK